MKKEEKFFARVKGAERNDIERAFGALLVKWKTIVQPSHLMTVETMNKTVKCFFILQDMCFEERISIDMAEEKEETYLNDVTVCGTVNPVRAGLVWVSERAVISATAG